MSTFDIAEVFSAREIARAAGVPVRRVRESMVGDYVPHSEAVRIGRALARGLSVTPAAAADQPLVARPLFAPPPGTRRQTGLPLAVSSTLHAAVVAGAVLITTLGLAPTAADTRDDLIEDPVRLVYLALPGPGGGGGGGGLRQPAPPPRAQRKGERKISSPLPLREAPKPIEPVEKPVEPPKPLLNAEQLPPIVAPVVSAPGDQRDRIGVLEQTTAQAESRGPGTGGGVGSGRGTGLGEGDGSGIGPGSGGGTGGGPYRPGSGIQPPRLLREVKPDYTEDARRRGVEGDVLLEIVVRSDGSVGDVRILQGLGAGLDQRAAQAVRQWRFAPARRLGTPVDVIVEVAVEFKLR